MEIRARIGGGIAFTPLEWRDNCRIGYVNGKVLPGRSSMLVPRKLREGEGSPVNRMADSTLFRAFAQLEPTKDAIQEFANQNGPLSFQFRVAGMRSHLRGDPHWLWTYHIVTLRFWIDVWELARAANAAELRKHVKAESPRLREVIPAGVEALEHVSPQIEPSDRQIVENAKSMVGVAIGNHIDDIRFHLTYLADQQRAVFDVVAFGLAPVLWFQFGAAVSENRHFGKCETCGREFEITPEIARSHRRYCDHKCRLKAFRKRKREAREYRSKGKTLREIAKLVESDVETVKGWVG